MKIKRIQIDICEPCLNGEGEECHTPECALFLHRVDLPIQREMYEVVSEYDNATPSEAEAKAEIEAQRREDIEEHNRERMRGICSK